MCLDRPFPRDHPPSSTASPCGAQGPSQVPCGAQSPPQEPLTPNCRRPTVRRPDAGGPARRNPGPPRRLPQPGPCRLPRPPLVRLPAAPRAQKTGGGWAPNRSTLRCGHVRSDSDIVRGPDRRASGPCVALRACSRARVQARACVCLRARVPAPLHGGARRVPGVPRGLLRSTLVLVCACERARRLCPCH